MKLHQRGRIHRDSRLRSYFFTFLNLFPLVSAFALMAFLIPYLPTLPDFPERRELIHNIVFIAAPPFLLLWPMVPYFFAKNKYIESDDDNIFEVKYDSIGKKISIKSTRKANIKRIINVEKDGPVPFTSLGSIFLLSEDHHQNRMIINLQDLDKSELEFSLRELKNQLPNVELRSFKNIYGLKIAAHW